MDTVVRLFPYKLPINTADKWRQGVIVEIEDEEGFIGHGEAAPLEGFSEETLSDVLDPSVALSSEYPSMQFALDMAHLEILSTKEGKPIRQLLNPQALDFLPVHPLIDSARGDGAQGLSSNKNNLGPVVKLKVGTGRSKSIQEAIDVVNSWSCEGYMLRVDANRSWTLDEALAFAKGVKGASIDYLEEPLKDPALLADFVAQTKMPIALDETLYKNEIESVDLKTISTFVIKPTLIGALAKLQRLVKVANEHGIQIVISSSFESNLGLRQLTQLAAAWHKEGCPAGLDTARFFLENLGHFPMRDYVIDMKAVDKASSAMPYSPAPL